MENKMSRAISIIAISVLLVAAVLSVGCAKEQVSLVSCEYTFSAFDYPGASLTQAYGNNSRGDIVGTYQLPTGRDSTVLPKGVQNATGKEYRGFVFKDGKFTTIDYPSFEDKKTDYTIATSIDNNGVVYGYYANEKESLTAAYGFKMDKNGNWSTIENKVDPSMGEPTMRPSPMRVGPDGTQYG